MKNDFLIILFTSLIWSSVNYKGLQGKWAVTAFCQAYHLDEIEVWRKV